MAKRLRECRSRHREIVLIMDSDIQVSAVTEHLMEAKLKKYEYRCEIGAA